MLKKFAKKGTFGKLPENRPDQNNWLLKIGRVFLHEKGV